MAKTFMHINEAVTENKPNVKCQDFSKAISSITLKFDLSR